MSEGIEIIIGAKQETKEIVSVDDIQNKPQLICPVCYNTIDLLPEDLTENGDISSEVLNNFNKSIEDFLISHNQFKQAFFNFRQRKLAQVSSK